MKSDRGSAAIEMLILAPGVIAFFVLVVIAGRTVLAHQAADAAAFSTARTASLARTEGEAIAQGDLAARDSLARQGINCRSLTITIEAGEFSVPVGQSATVRARITCVAELSDIALPGMPGTLTLVSEFTSPLDRYRSRT